MTGKKNSSLKIKRILVIADQERLQHIFDTTEVPGVQFTSATSIAEGIKAAKKDAPFLIFIQGRMGGFSAEILSRHLLLELKDTSAKIVFLCTPDDMPLQGNKGIYAGVDVSLEDEELRSEALSVVNSVLIGGKGKAPRQRQPSGVRKERPGSREKTEAQAAAAGPDSMETLPEHGDPHDRAEVADTVDIGMDPSAAADAAQQSTVPAAETNVAPLLFRETLDDALEKRGAESPEKIPPAGGKKKAKVAVAVALALVAAGAAVGYHFYNYPLSGTSGQTTGSVPGPSAVEPGKTAGKQSTETRQPQRPLRGYMKYTVRRGDTIVSILKDRFGFSEREAQIMIPEIRGKNGVAQSSGLRIGQILYIPVPVEELPAPKPAIHAKPAPLAPKPHPPAPR